MNRVMFAVSAPRTTDDRLVVAAKIPTLVA